MAGKKNPNLGDKLRQDGDKLRQERQGAENTLRDSRNKAADSSTGDSSKKKAEHRRQIRHEADLAKMRSKKLKSEQEVKAKKNAAASGKKGGKPKKPGNLAADALSAKAHQSVRNADQDNNSGVEAAHFTEGSAEGAARAGSRFQYGRKLRQYKKLERLEKKADKDAVDSIFAERMKSDPQAGSNFFSRWRQKQAIKKEYAAAKNTAAGTAKAAQGTASMTEKAFQFVQSHSHIIIGIVAVGLLPMAAEAGYQKRVCRCEGRCGCCGEHSSWHNQSCAGYCQHDRKGISVCTEPLAYHHRYRSCGTACFGDCRVGFVLLRLDQWRRQCCAGDFLHSGR